MLWKFKEVPSCTSDCIPMTQSWGFFFIYFSFQFHHRSALGINILFLVIIFVFLLKIVFFLGGGRGIRFWHPLDSMVALFLQNIIPMEIRLSLTLIPFWRSLKTCFCQWCWKYKIILSPSNGLCNCCYLLYFVFGILFLKSICSHCG